MFVQFTDSEGRETWINPLQVKVVRDQKGLLGGKKGTEIWFSFNSTSEAIYIPQPPTQVAALLDVALPKSFTGVLDDESDEGFGSHAPVHS